MGAESSPRSACETAPGTAIFSISGNVVRPGNYELELGTPMRELIYEHGGGIAGGRELKAVIPGGSSVPALTPDQIDVAARLRLAGRAQDLLRRGVADRGRRPLLHGAARAALDRSSTCTSRAASARRAARERAGWCRSSRRSSAATGSSPTSTCSLESASGSSARCSARSATSPSIPVSSFIAHLARRVRRPHRSRAAARSTATRRSRAILAPVRAASRPRTRRKPLAVIA